MNLFLSSFRQQSNNLLAVITIMQFEIIAMMCNVKSSRAKGQGGYFARRLCNMISVNHCNKLISGRRSVLRCMRYYQTCT